MKKVLCKVSEEEMKKIKDAFEKKNALENLIKIVDVNSDTYSRIIDDYVLANQSFNDSWSSIINTYDCPKDSSNNLMLDFQSHEVFVIEDDR